MIDRSTGAVEGSAEHFNTDWHAQNVSCEFDMSVQVVNT